MNPADTGNIVQESLPTAPPSPLIDSNMAGVIEATPLPVQTSKLEVTCDSVVAKTFSDIARLSDEVNAAFDADRRETAKRKRDTLGTISKKTKAIDDPVVIKRREEIRAARVLNMARARAHRKTVAA